VILTQTKPFGAALIITIFLRYPSPSANFPLGKMSNEMQNSYMTGAMSSEGQALTDPSDPLDLLTSKSNPPVQESLGNLFNLGPTPASIALSADEQNIMVKAIKDVFVEEKSQSEDQAMADGDDDDNEELDPEDQRSKTQKLKTILPLLTQLWWSEYQNMALVTETLADGSRDRKSTAFIEQWRKFQSSYSFFSQAGTTPRKQVAVTFCIAANITFSFIMLPLSCTKC
jgi:hypothetical protein